MTSFLWCYKDYNTENTSSKWRHKIFQFSSPYLSKILVALLLTAHESQALTVRPSRRLKLVLKCKILHLSQSTSWFESCTCFTRAVLFWFWFCPVKLPNITFRCSLHRVLKLRPVSPT